MIGQQIGQYQIVEAIGQGGMATVYKAYQPAFDRHVAIKVLSRQLSDDPTFVKRFQREAKVVARIEHRFIVPLYDYGEEQGIYYMVMRLIEGGTLRRKMFYDKIDLSFAARAISQVAEALDFAHSRDVIHRDLKPSNILLDERSNAFLTDFGIAKMVGSNTQVTQSGVVGTPSYMSPEQCQGKTLTSVSDVYALGAILFEVLTGSVPYEADTPLTVMYMHVKDPIPSARALNSKLPAGIDKVFLRALAKQPKDRYSTAAALAKAFREVAGVSDESIATPAKPQRKSALPALPSLPTLFRKPEQPAPPEPAAPPTVEAGDGAAIEEPPPAAEATPIREVAGYDDAPSEAPRLAFPKVSQTVLYSVLSGVLLVGLVGLGIFGLSSLKPGGPTILPPPPIVVTITLAPTSGEATPTLDIPTEVVTDSITESLTATDFVGGIIEPSNTPVDTDTPVPVFSTEVPTAIPSDTPIPPSETPTDTALPPTDTAIPTATDTAIPPSPTVAPPSGKIAYTEGLNQSAEIMVIDASGGNRHRITNNGEYDGEPDWSPDGSRIAYEASDGTNTDIYTMAANGSDVRRLTTAPEVDRHPDWSPNGSLIAYESGQDDASEIWVMAADGTNQTRLTNNTYGDRAPQFSPDGTKIAYMTHQRDRWEIAIMAYPGGNQLSLFACPDPDCRFPAWSPDGTQIAFNTLDSSHVTEKNIYILTLATGEMKLVVVGGQNGRPAWSGDGKWLFFNKAVTDTSDVYRMYIASGEVVKLTSTSSQAYGPDWGP